MPDIKLNARIGGIVGFNLITYILIGLPLGVLPGLVHVDLGFSAVTAGFLISLQYVATLVTRSPAGRICDVNGPKWAVLGGLGCGAVSGVFILAAGHVTSNGAELVCLGMSRVWLGAAESGTGTGCIAWGIGRLGPAHTAQIISWTGITSYGGIGLGAPLGVALYHAGGLTALGAASFCPALLGAGVAWFRPGAAVVGGARLGAAAVLRHVLPFGLALALASAGFGMIVAFITLYFSAHGWANAAYALTGFGVSLVAVRAGFGTMINRFGGFNVALLSLLVECLGFVTLWLAQTRLEAILGAAVAGAGFSLIFPALAVETLRTMPAANRGAAVGIYTVFADLSLGVTGPLAGLVIGWVGYAPIYLLAAMGTIAAGGLAFWLRAVEAVRRS